MAKPKLIDTSDDKLWYIPTLDINTSATEVWDAVGGLYTIFFEEDATTQFYHNGFNDLIEKLGGKINA